MTKSKFPNSISDRVFDLCNSSETVSSLLAKDPSLSPSDAWNKLYGQHTLKNKKRHLGDSSSEEEEAKEEEYSISGTEDEEEQHRLNNPDGHQGSTASAYKYYQSPLTPPHSPTFSAQEHLDRAAECGKRGGKRPSDLFLQVTVVPMVLVSLVDGKSTVLTVFVTDIS